MNIKEELAPVVAGILNGKAKERSIIILPEEVLINHTPSDFEGDYTVVLFPFVKKLGMNPNELGEWLGAQLQEKAAAVRSFNIVKGFLNLAIGAEYWREALLTVSGREKWGHSDAAKGTVMMEYPSPNTNKPLHLGHLRNVFLGYSLSRILEANGYKVVQVCLYNDRGTNISKSMLMYLKSDNKLTPETSGIKGDKLVGDYYVQYNQALEKELAEIIREKDLEAAFPDKDKRKAEAKKYSVLEKEVADLTIRWEQGDAEVRGLWKTMNGWFYSGVHRTYEMLRLTFEKEYYESDIYNKGRETVEEGLEKGIFFRKDDGSVWIDLTDIGLDQKVVLRSNGTTVYITQDMALAYQKQKDFDFERSVYVVGNEQDYHFKVLFEILRRLKMKASDHLFHLSYGMVELPTGKMKTREGTIVEGDDLIEEVIYVAREKADEQGKLSEVDDDAKEEIYKMIGIGALRYFILKVDPAKKIIFNPQESIDFNGNTAPFIQYMYARTQSLRRNARTMGLSETPDAALLSSYSPNDKEQKLLRWLMEFPEVVKEAGEKYSPALIANYVYQLAADFSAFYHDHKVLREENEAARNFRLSLSVAVGNVIRNGLYLLGIDAPNRM